VGAPIALPARLAGIRALRHFFPVTQDLHHRKRHSVLLQDFRRPPRPPIAQAEVVFRRTAIVAMALHHDHDSRFIAQQLGVITENGESFRERLGPIVRKIGIGQRLV
jgi:hypothetical protein